MYLILVDLLKEILHQIKYNKTYAVGINKFMPTAFLKNKYIVEK